MSSKGNINVFFGKREPIDRSALWVKPMSGGGFELYTFLSGWRQYEATGIKSSTGNIVCGVDYTTSDGDGNTGDFLCIIQSRQDGEYETIYIDLAEITREIKERLAQAEADIDALETRMDTAEADIDALEQTTTSELVAYGELNKQSYTIDLKASTGETLSKINISGLVSSDGVIVATYTAGDGIEISSDNVISIEDDYVAALNTLMTEEELDQVILATDSGVAESMGVTS